LRSINYAGLARELREFSQPTNRYEELSKALNADELMSIAQKKAGLSDFGSDSFIEPYKKLLDCAAQDVDFSAEGLEDFKYHIVRCLVNKLRIHDDFLRHPEILEEDVSDPIVVIGLPRTGTTKMQRILSALPATQIQKTYLWQMLNPAPFPNAQPGRADPRIAAAAMGRFTSDGRPEYEAAHIVTAQEPEEDGLVCDSTFDDWVWSSVFAPSLHYYEWVMQRPHRENYRHLQRMYKYLQWQNGGRRSTTGHSRRWVTKNVQHIAHMGELLEFFPNATLIHCHRTPQLSIPSLAKLTMEMWRPIVKQVDPVFTGQAMFKWWHAATERYLIARDKLQLDERIIDIPYERIRNDAINVVQEIYSGIGSPLSPEQLRYIVEWENNNEQHKHGQLFIRWRSSV
jgi:hypothetical protein